MLQQAPAEDQEVLCSFFVSSLLAVVAFSFAHMVKSMKRASKGKLCLGVFRSSAKCTLARDKSGSPILLCRNCKECGEQRCKAHCKCARTGSAKAKGRGASRGYVGGERASRTRVAVATPAAATTAAAAVAAPNGRPSSLSCTLLETSEWYRRCCADLSTASEVEVASYMYDCPDVQKKLLQRLRGKCAFAVNVYVDKEKFEKGEAPRRSGQRLDELRAAGAKVYMCKGRAGRGSYHCKAVVIDRRHMYTGNANLTYQSMDNEEFVFRVTGPPVKQVLERLSEHRLKSKLWNGV